MLAIVYLLIALLIGDQLCRRFFTFTSLPHRLAADLLIGLLVCTWASYLAALVFAWTANPMLYGNIVFFAAAFGILFLGYRKRGSWNGFAPTETDDASDWIFAGLMLLFSCWLMFGTFGITADNLQIAAFLTNDFGPNLAIVQSFAVGHNFPTEYPHFIGEPIRYHFLFWFQAGNLEFLGLNIAWALNLLSTLTLAAMLLTIDAFGRAVFDSKAAGRIASVLFFFHGALSYIPYLMSKGSVSEMLFALVGATEWLPSIYKYTGEQWGVWSMGTFLAQRHLPAAIGVLLIVMLFVIGEARKQDQSQRSKAIGYLFAGSILGLLPMWNGAVFVAGFAVIASLFVLFPKRLKHSLLLLAVSAVVTIPQILMLRSAGSRGILELFRWGYVVDPPTVWNVLEYFSFTFGVKFLLALIAASLLTAFHRKLFIAAFSLVVLAFCTQLSTDVMNNHKFLNVWLVLMNAYAAYTIVRLAKVRYAGKALAAVLMIFICVGGTIELFRIRNINMVDVPYGSGPLYEWLYANTQPEDIFLTNNHVTHPILLSGRRIFYGWAYFGWSMGYPTGTRDEEIKRLFSETNVTDLINLLNQKNIRYVAFDDGLRTSHMGSRLNERVFEQNFERVFTAPAGKYGSLVIYRVPPPKISANNGVTP